MELIIKNATILSGNSPHHGKKKDIYINNGVIQKIDNQISPSGSARMIEGKNVYCTAGLADIGTHTCDPGLEHRETINSLAKAARSGGYTILVTVPNTFPYTETKADIQYLIQKGKECGIAIKPLGALSAGGAGKDIAEYFDMHTAGAVGFSDGLVSCQDAGLLSRALHYVKAFGGLIVHHPEDKTLRGKGLVHEGYVSTSLGLMGVPSLAEVVALQRDLLLRDYTDSRLLVHAISSAESVPFLQAAKEKSGKLFASVAYQNLIASDDNVEGFDVNYKVKPVLRSREDRAALIQAVKNNVIDVIVSNHVPVDEDGKKVEFPYAENGASGIETAFIATVDSLSDTIDLATLVSKFNDKPREILGLDAVKIEEGQQADLCIFETGNPRAFTKSFSLSTNNPLLNTTFQTRILATVAGDNMVTT